MTMIIINDDWRITSDRMNYTLEQRIVIQNGQRKGEADWKAEGYFSNPLAALYALVRQEIATAEQTLQIHQFTKMYREVAESYRHKVETDRATDVLSKLAVELPRPSAQTDVKVKKLRQPSRK